MKKQNRVLKKKFLKKIFVKICRLFGFEIIDQNNFYVPTQEKMLNENLNIQGVKSITLPLGEVKISRKVKSLTIIFRSCTNVEMMQQNKKRLFEKNKSDYTFRSLNSIINSMNKAKINLPKIKFDIIVIDHNSKKEDILQIKNQLNKSDFENSIIHLDTEDFISNINKINAKNENVTKNMISNMCNIHKSLLTAKNLSSDLIYFVEDDYLHEIDAISEMLLTYERLSSQLNKELILCPTDYPYLYTKLDLTNIFLGSNKHWRKVNETLCTFLTSRKIVEKHWDKFTSMCKFEHIPFEKPLHDIYQIEYCLSPMPSMAIHFTNINSIYGYSPTIDWKKIWDENDKY